MKMSVKRIVTHVAVFVILTLAGARAAGDAQDADASIRRDGETWTLSNPSAQRTVALQNGKLLLTSLKDKATNREFIPAGAEPQAFSVTLGGEPRPDNASAPGPWELVGAEQKQLDQGEQQLDITVRRGPLQVTKTYVLYPHSSIVREWATFRNAGDAPLQLVEPHFLDFAARLGDPTATDFHWMTGGENQPGSWALRTESLAGKSEEPRTFDSYDPFPTTTPFPGDGVGVKILINDRQVWPAEGDWTHIANATVRVPLDVTADVKEGDRLVFLVNAGGTIFHDTTAFDPTIAYDDGGASHTASKEFSGEQGRNGWRYQYVEGGKLVDLVYYPGPNQWRKEKDNPTGTPFVGSADQHPDAGQDAARVWTAPKAGRVRITGSIGNTGNRAAEGKSGYGFRAGSGSYAPWYALYSRDTKQGLFIGFDYFGHWAASFSPGDKGQVVAQLKVAGHKQTLAPGESVTTPKAFVGLFRDDLDNAGNELLDWQYRYLWDYTREKEGWFPAIRMLGYWMHGTPWGKPGFAWIGGKPDMESTFRKVFRVTDLMRYVGADVYHRDWGWWDRAGDWNGPDFRATGQYLRKHGIGQLIYAFLYTVDPASRVAKEHPDWLLPPRPLLPGIMGGATLDMSKPEVVEFMKGQLDDFVQRWGDFEWRNDGIFTSPRNGDDTPLLAQDQGFRKLLRDFLDKHPGCAFQAVNLGGNYAGYDYVRYASALSFSDAAVGILRNYHAALLFPPDKCSDIPDAWNPNDYDKATWRGLLCINFDMTGDTWDRAKLEGVRELIDIYHYLHREGVVGRWVRVHRPLIDGDDPTMYFQRLSGDRRRGIIIPKRPAPGPVTIRPKGLLPDQTYVVSFHESNASEQRRGDELMGEGVRIERMPPGELIYLNLPLYPGSKLDKQPPKPPVGLTVAAGENMGYPGVELTWRSGSDDNWLSYHEVFRDGAPIDKMAKGTFYFDHSAGADPVAKYEVRAVDGAGNPSEKTARAESPGEPPVRARVFDDAEGGGVVYDGAWQHVIDLQPAHAGTISVSDQPGARAEVSFEGGRRVRLFGKLGPNCGKATVSLDHGPPQTIDTYSADDIWGVCVYSQDLPPGGGKHTLRIEVLGAGSERSSGAFFHVDGIRVERGQ